MIKDLVNQFSQNYYFDTLLMMYKNNVSYGVIHI